MKSNLISIIVDLHYLHCVRRRVTTPPPDADNRSLKAKLTSETSQPTQSRMSLDHVDGALGNAHAYKRWCCGRGGPIQGSVYRRRTTVAPPPFYARSRLAAPGVAVCGSYNALKGNVRNLGFRPKKTLVSYDKCGGYGSRLQNLTSRAHTVFAGELIQIRHSTPIRSTALVE